MRKIWNFGYIGLGWIAHHTVSSFGCLENARVLAAASRTPGKAADFAKQYGIERSYETYEAIVEDPDVDIIYICTPVITHKAVIELCLTHGKHVICEKPLAMTADDAREILEIQRSSGAFCMEAMWTRFIPAIRRMQEIIVSGELGEIRMVHADYAIDWPYNPDYHLYKLADGGSTLLDQGIYPITFASLAFGSIPNRCTGLANLRSGVDIRSGSVLGFENGGIAAITTGADVATSWRADVYGEKGSLAVEEFYHPTRLILHRNGAAAEEIIDLPYESTGYQFEMQEVIDCLERGALQSEIMPLSESVRITEVMDGLRHQFGVFYPSERV